MVERWDHKTDDERRSYVQNIMGDRTVGWTRADSILIEASLQESEDIARLALELALEQTLVIEQRTLHRAEFENSFGAVSLSGQTVHPRQSVLRGRQFQNYFKISNLT